MCSVADRLVERDESPSTLVTTFTKVKLAEHMTDQPATDRLRTSRSMRSSAISARSRFSSS